MRVYISGKIGEEVISAYTLQKFAKAEQMLKSKGYEVFNPTKSGLGAHAESLAMKNGTTFWEEIVILDLEELKKCSAIYMLEDWKKSDGAQTEYYYARGAGKKMFFQNRIHGCEGVKRRGSRPKRRRGDAKDRVGRGALAPPPSPRPFPAAVRPEDGGR